MKNLAIYSVCSKASKVEGLTYEEAKYIKEAANAEGKRLTIWVNGIKLP